MWQRNWRQRAFLGLKCTRKQMARQSRAAAIDERPPMSEARAGTVNEATDYSRSLHTVVTEWEADLDILEGVAENLSDAGDGAGCVDADAKAKALRKLIKAAQGHSAISNPPAAPRTWEAAR